MLFVVFTQQFRKYTPLPFCAGTKFTEPLPFTITLPVKPGAQTAGVNHRPILVTLKLCLSSGEVSRSQEPPLLPHLQWVIGALPPRCRSEPILYTARWVYCLL